MTSQRCHFAVDDIAGTTVVRFVGSLMINEANVHGIGAELLALVDKEGRKRIVLDFSNVEYLNDPARFRDGPTLPNVNMLAECF